MKIKRRKADILFSQYIRTRDRWTCQKCHKRYKPKSQGLHCAHMFSRRKESTRFDPDNCCSLCFGCHQYIDSHPFEKIEFFEKRLGKERLAKLRLKSNIQQKKDDNMVILWCKQAIKKELNVRENSRNNLGARLGA